MMFNSVVINILCLKSKYRSLLHQFGGHVARLYFLFAAVSTGMFISAAGKNNFTFPTHRPTSRQMLPTYKFHNLKPAEDIPLKTDRLLQFISSLSFQLFCQVLLQCTLVLLHLAAGLIEIIR